jgi:two-component system chemotaxis response regulator CheY
MSEDGILRLGMTAEELEDTVHFSQRMVQDLLEIIGENLTEVADLRRENQALRAHLERNGIDPPIVPAVAPSKMEVEAALAAAEADARDPADGSATAAPGAAASAVGAPASSPKPEALASAAPEAAAPDGGVLIVDDSRMLQLRLKSIIEPLGYKVAGLANNGAEGLALALETRPRCVVLDYNMPELDGLETAHQLRQKLPGVRILICAAEMDPVLSADFQQEGVVDVLQKPIQLDTFVRAIRKAMAE